MNAYRRGVLAEMKGEATPGHCFLCDAPIAARLGPGRPRVMCRAVECKREYERLWRFERIAQAAL